MSSLLLEPELPDRVRRSLSEALPGASIGEIEVADGRPSLLLLQVNHILAAFAFGTDDEAYRGLYSGFKKHYLSKGEQWRSLDVSFVYCLPPSARPTEAFCSEVEADVYFCRKFIVPLSDDISSSLLRLPFLPLAPLAGSPLRPPSAQTLLQRSNVRADLARFLVVQNARGAQSILADCLANKFGGAEPPTEVQFAHEQRQDRGLSPISLESLTIQNFRAYRKSKTFTFGSAITVLYGPNGFGKTSFFDALDFAVTGSIGRLPSTTDHALTKAVRHLDSHNDPCTVALTFKRGEGTHTIVRDLSDPKQAKLDSKKGIGRKEVLTMLTGGEGPAADRVENFISLFRATHLFSQERQELTQDFQAKSELSSDLVSRMLAFEDYVSGIKKTNEVQGLIKSAMERGDKELARLEALVEKDQAELSRLEGLAAAKANPAGIEAEVKSLKKDLIETGIDIKDMAVDASTLRGWRAQLESRGADLSNQGASLSKAMGDLQRARTLVLELNALQSKLAELDAALATADASRVRADELVRTANLNLAQARDAAAAVQRTYDSLAWLAANRAEYGRLVKERDSLKAKVDLATQQDARLRHDEGLAASVRQTAEQTFGELSQQVGASSARLQSLQSLGRQQPAVTAASSRLKEVSDVERDCIDAIKSARTHLDHAKEAQASVQVQVARLDSEVSAREASRTEVKSLLAQLRGHVTDGTCLFCGVDHGSRDALLAHLDARLNQDGQVAEARARLAERQTEAARVAEQIAGHQRRLDDVLARQDALRSEREQLERIIAQFSLDAAALDVVLPTASASPEENVDAAVKEAELVLAALTEKHGAAARAKNAAVSASEDAKAAISSNTAVMQGATKALESVLEAIARLVNDPRRVVGAGFDFELDALLTEIERSTRDLQSAKATVAEAQAQADHHKAELGRKSQEAAAARKALEDAQRRRGTVTSTVSDLSASLAQVGLAPESPDEAVTGLISANSSTLARLAAIRDRTANLEVALDAVTTAAALASLQTSLRQHLASINSAREDRARHEPWGKYFEAVARLLSTQQNSATDQFTREYGPRTAVIQRRLRPVYGFGNVEVSSKGGSISVRVARNGEALRPIDYFSQSQIQTLVLGLFLTACSSQTWSAFSSVMMDDPVTHFDDLNTYALLDLIAGLLRSEDGARQFVISTCDEKLFQLARQKFRHLKDGAKFYRFSAIGAEGPLVSEIPA